MSDTTPDFADEEVIEPEQVELVDVAAEENAARENFTLADLFGGPSRPGTLPEKKRLIFLKPKLVEEYDNLRLVVARKKGILEAAQEPQKPERGASAEDKAQYKAALDAYQSARADLEAEVAEDEKQVEAAREEMLKHALSFHLRAYPQVALKVARREARKLFVDPQTGKLREGYEEDDFQEWMNLRLFGETVQKVVRNDGTEVEFGVPKSELGEMLSNGQNMHPTSWLTLYQDFEELTIRAGVRARAVEDPGF